MTKLGLRKDEIYFQSPNMSVRCNHISISGSCELDRPETGSSWVTSSNSCF